MSFNSEPRSEPTHSASREQYALEQHNNEVDTEVRPYKCETCGKEFKWKSHLRFHERIHTGERPYQCEFCEKAFTQKAHLNTHKKAMHVNKSYKCIVCEEVFKTRQNLRNHIDTDHSREKLYKCNQCPYVFKSTGGLNRHYNNTHIKGEKPFRCEICDKVFRTKYLKDQHIIVHSDTKPHECLMCDKKFKHRSSLLVHVKNKDHADGIVKN